MSVPSFKPLDEVDAVAYAMDPLYKRHKLPDETRHQRARRHERVRERAEHVIRVLDAYRKGGYQGELDL